MEKYIWVALAVGSLPLPTALWANAQPRLADCPSLRPGYRRLIRGFAAWLVAPWLAMGIGSMAGGLPPDAFVRPATTGPWAWPFWATAYGSFAYAVWWAARGGGAEVLARYSWALPVPARSARQFKAWVAGVMVAVTLWNTGFLLWLA